MAGKHLGGDLPTPINNPEAISHHFSPKLDRAYSEGRQVRQAGGSSGLNPHPAGSPAAEVWDDGHLLGVLGAAQFETAFP